MRVVGKKFDTNFSKLQSLIQFEDLSQTTNQEPLIEADTSFLGNNSTGPPPACSVNIP